MRKIFSILAATMMLTTSLCAQEISLKINDQVIETEVQPIQEDGTTLVPIRVVTEHLGAQVEWNEETQTVTIVKGNQKIELTIGSKVVKVNGVEQTLQCAPQLIEGTTMVPIRLVSENFGGTVGWEEETGTVSIQTSTEGAADTDNTTDTENTGDTDDEGDTDNKEDTTKGPGIDMDNIIYTGILNASDKTYTGEYKIIDGVYTPHGEGKLVCNDGTYVEGIFERGYLVDGKKVTHNGHIIQEGSFGEDGNLYEGTVTCLYEDEELKVIVFVRKGIWEDTYIYNLEGDLIAQMTYEEFQEMFK